MTSINNNTNQSSFVPMERAKPAQEDDAQSVRSYDSNASSASTRATGLECYHKVSEFLERADIKTKVRSFKYPMKSEFYVRLNHLLEPVVKLQLTKAEMIHVFTKAIERIGDEIDNMSNSTRNRKFSEVVSNKRADYVVVCPFSKYCICGNHPERARPFEEVKVYQLNAAAAVPPQQVLPSAPVAAASVQAVAQPQAMVPPMVPAPAPIPVPAPAPAPAQAVVPADVLAPAAAPALSKEEAEYLEFLEFKAMRARAAARIGAGAGASNASM
jgi:hypothetical protein